MSINRYTLSSVLPKVNRNKHRTRIRQIGLVTGTLELDQDLRWRDLLGIAAVESKDKIAGALSRYCRFIPPDEVANNLDKSIRDTTHNRSLSKPETTEVQMLRAYFTGAQVVAITEEALENIEPDTVDHWKALLSDRLVFIYYRYDSQYIGRWGEKYSALLAHDTEESLGIAPVDWINENRETVKSLLTGRGADEDDKRWDDFELDDDEDDED
jgi:hypothetical protein